MQEKTGHARETRKERGTSLSPRVFFVRSFFFCFFFSPKYFQGPATRATTIVDKIDGKFIPSSQIKDGKVACFGFYSASSFLWGDLGLLFHFIVSKIVRSRLILILTS